MGLRRRGIPKPQLELASGTWNHKERWHPPFTGNDILMNSTRARSTRRNPWAPSSSALTKRVHRPEQDPCPSAGNDTISQGPSDQPLPPWESKQPGPAGKTRTLSTPFPNGDSADPQYRWNRGGLGRHLHPLTSAFGPSSRDAHRTRARSHNQPCRVCGIGSEREPLGLRVSAPFSNRRFCRYVGQGLTSNFTLRGIGASWGPPTRFMCRPNGARGSVAAFFPSRGPPRAGFDGSPSAEHR